MSVAETVFNKCDFKGCSHAPMFAPVIHVPFIGLSLDQHEPLSAEIGLRLCERHITSVKVEDFSNMKPLFEELASSLPNTLQADWTRAYFSKIKLTSANAAA